MCSQWAGAALAAAAVAAGALPAASAEVCSASSVPEVRYCLDDEFCCWRGCCTRSMLYFFKLSVAVVLIVMILVWLCNYLRRGRNQHECPPDGRRGPVQQQPAAFGPRAHQAARLQTTHAPYPVHPHPVHSQPQPPAPAQPPPAPLDDLPPPYHAVVNMPPALLAPTHLPSYDASCKAMTGPA